MVQEIDIEGTNETTIPLIDSKGAKITIPREAFLFPKAQERVRVASLLFRNMSGFLPQRLNEDVTTIRFDKGFNIIGVIDQLCTHILFMHDPGGCCLWSH